jgi:hypothetical protein
MSKHDRRCALPRTPRRAVAAVATTPAAAVFAPAALANNTTYFWQIVATNASGSTTGLVWSFTTDGMSDIVIDASVVPAAGLQRSWTAPSRPTAANGAKLVTSEAGVATTGRALASPVDDDMTLDASANTPYSHLAAPPGVEQLEIQRLGFGAVLGRRREPIADLRAHLYGRARRDRVGREQRRRLGLAERRRLSVTINDGRLRDERSTHDPRPGARGRRPAGSDRAQPIAIPERGARFGESRFDDRAEAVATDGRDRLHRTNGSVSHADESGADRRQAAHFDGGDSREHSSSREL